MHIGRKERLHRAHHEVALAAVGVLDALDVRIHVVIAKVPMHDALGQLVGVQVSGLLGNHELFHDLSARDNPPQADAGRDDL